MSRRVSFLFAGAALGFLLSMSPTPASAQPFWIPRDGNHAIMLEFLRPSVEGIDRSALSSAYFLSARIALSPHFSVVGELPYSSYKASFIGTDINGNEITIEESASSIGNLYLGIEGSPGESPIFGEFGVRVPMADEGEGEALGIGLLSDVARWEAFLPKAVFFEGAFNLREVTSSNIEYRMRFSPVLRVATDTDYYDDAEEIYVNYAWAVGYHGSNFRLGTALSGRVLVTEDSGNLGQRSLNQFELHADVGPWSVRPGFDLHLPLDSWGEEVPIVLGVNVSWSPGGAAQ